MAKITETEKAAPRLGYSVEEFCEAFGLSRGTFYNRLKDGTAPRCMRVGTRRIISSRAAEEWQRDREDAGDVG